MYSWGSPILHTTRIGERVGASGLALDAANRLVLCALGDRRVAMVTDVNSFRTLTDRHVEAFVPELSHCWLTYVLQCLRHQQALQLSNRSGLSQQR